MLHEYQLKQLELVVREAEEGPGYFAEALNSFRAGAYRASVLMMSNAVFMHAIQKLEYAALIEGSYRTALDDVNDRRKQGVAFEGRLVSCLSGGALLDEECLAYLTELRRFRNVAAHPNGGKIRDSDAATLLRDGVKLFLSQKHLNPLVTVEEIVGRIKDPEYFQRQFGNEARSALVSSEIKLLPATAFERLAERVVKLFREADVAIHDNATTFLSESVGMQNDRLTSAVVKKLIQSKLRAKNPPSLLQAIVEVLNRQVGCIKFLDVDERGYLDKILFGLFEGSASTRDTLTPAGSLALKLADSSNFDKIRSALTASLTLGLTLMTNPQVPKELRRSFAMNLRRSARDFGPDGARFVNFIQSHGEELIDVLNDGQVCDLLEALKYRRIGGPGGKNFSNTGECLTDPESMRFSEDEAPLIQFEQNLRSRISTSSITANLDDHGRPRRCSTPA